MATKTDQQRLFVLKLESYEGEDTFLRCGDEQQDFLYSIVAIDDDGTAQIVDSSYRSLAEAVEAWPQARPRTMMLPGKADRTPPQRGEGL